MYRGMSKSKYLTTTITTRFISANMLRKTQISGINFRGLFFEIFQGRGRYFSWQKCTDGMLVEALSMWLSSSHDRLQISMSSSYDFSHCG